MVENEFNNSATNQSGFFDKTAMKSSKSAEYQAILISLYDQSSSDLIKSL